MVKLMRFCPQLFFTETAQHLNFDSGYLLEECKMDRGCPISWAKIPSLIG